MLLEEVSQMMNPGYLPMETGYMQLSNGQWLAAALTRMPKVTGEMHNWWISYYLTNSEKYKAWDPKAHVRFEWDDKWRPGHYIGATHYGEEWMAGQLLKFKVRFDDPALFFDPAKYAEANVAIILCAESMTPDGTPMDRIIHFIRKTDYGCEMRSRFLIYHGNEQIARGHVEHCISEMGNMADFLPGLYAKESKRKI